MSFRPVQQLHVGRTLSAGETVAVGTLAQSRRGVFFQYHPAYLARFKHFPLSPYRIRLSYRLHQNGPTMVCTVFFRQPAWWLLLQDRVFRQHGIIPAQVTAKSLGRNWVKGQGLAQQLYRA